MKSQNKPRFMPIGPRETEYNHVSRRKDLFPHFINVVAPIRIRTTVIHSLFPSGYI